MQAQPDAPVLPDTAVTRVKWTQEMEDVIHTCAKATPGTYRNSMKKLTDNLCPEVPVTAIRNKVRNLGYRVVNKHLVIKEEIR